MRLYFKQFINIPAILQLKQLFFQPQLLLPHISINNINELNCQELINENIKYIIFDKDNTLTYTYSDELHPIITNKIQEFHNFFPNRIAILSNSAGSNDDFDYKEAKRISLKLNIPVITHKYKKPQCLSEVKLYFENICKKEVQNKEICVIGDRILTDIVFATSNGMLSVLVKPLSIIKDHPIAVIIRFFERNILLPIIKLLNYKPIKR